MGTANGNGSPVRLVQLRLIEASEAIWEYLASNPKLTAGDRKHLERTARRIARQAVELPDQLKPRQQGALAQVWEVLAEVYELLRKLKIW